MNWIKAHKVWTAVIAVVVIGIIGAAAGGGSSSDGTTVTGTASLPTTTPTTVATTAPPVTTPVATAPRPVALTTAQKVRAALGDKVSSDFAVGDSAAVRGVARSGKLLTVTLTTPEGGFDGPSTDDADGLASVAFAKTYLAGWDGGTVVRFLGGLADSSTGQEKPNAIAFSYFVGARAAHRINWSNQDNLHTIDWSIYREICVPVFKGCSG